LRDFTYIDDIVEGVVRSVDRVAEPNEQWDGASPDPGTSMAPYRLYNIGNNDPVQLMDYIACIEKALGKEAQKNFLPLQPGDVPETYADIDDLTRDIGYQPATKIEDGIAKFIEWYRGYYEA
jgi:UDP-glucuronate 4-epimerase